MTAQPLTAELCLDIDNKLLLSTESKERSKQLVENYSWDLNDTKKIWCFGPEDKGPNMLVDMTRSVQNLSDAKGSLSVAFQNMTSGGVLCDEEMRGIRFNIMDVLLHSDSVHRGDGQILPAARRVYCAAQLCASPRLLEPMFLCEVQTEASVVNSVYSVIAGRKGKVINEIRRDGTPLVVLKSFIPVASAFGLTAELRKATSGKAFPQCTFDHWSLMEGDPLLSDTKVHNIVMETRKRKGLPDKFPIFADYIDKL